MSPSATRKTLLPADEVGMYFKQALLQPAQFHGRGEGTVSSLHATEAPYPIVAIGPMTIHGLSVPELTERLVGDAETAASTHHVVTANAQFYNLAEQRKDFRDCMARAEYVCADGVSVVMACRWLAGTPVVRVPGVDLLDQLCGQSVARNLPVYFLGGKLGAAEMTAAILARKYPGFRTAGVACPDYGFEKDEALLAEVLDDIRRVNPAILFVAMGAPRQEFFIDRHIRPLGIPVAIGVGGSFEMIGGLVRRAPHWVQQAGLEWAYRWAQEPKRLAKRYLLGNAQFAFYVLRYLFKGQPKMKGDA